MFKKVCGALFFVASGLFLIGAISSDTFTKDYPSDEAMYGAIFAIVLVVVAYALSGLFMLTFDKAREKSYIEGFKTRKKQCKIVVAFVAFYFIMFIMMTMGAALSLTENYLLIWALSALLPFGIPFIFFSTMLSVYAIPFWSCNKTFGLDDAALSQYLSSSETFYRYSKDNFVLASNKILFFPSRFLVFPLENIASTKLVKVLAIEKDAYIYPINGKKVSVVLAREDQYSAIENAIKENKH